MRVVVEIVVWLCGSVVQTVLHQFLEYKKKKKQAYMSKVIHIYVYVCIFLYVYAVPCLDCCAVPSCGWCCFIKNVLVLDVDYSSGLRVYPLHHHDDDVHAVPSRGTALAVGFALRRATARARTSAPRGCWAAPLLGGVIEALLPRLAIV
jgi:hypothetical protein